MSRQTYKPLQLLLLLLITYLTHIKADNHTGTNTSTNTNTNTVRLHRDTTEEESSCVYHDSCHSCTLSYGCHWCEFDHMCHAKGSIYGCFAGVEDCPALSPTTDGDSADSADEDVPDEPEDQSCFALKTCGECSGTYTCHWCEHDNACHLKGSLYGCLNGVSCYNNDRCQRKEPESVAVDIFPLPESSPDTAITWTEFIGVICFAVGGLLGITCLFCSAGIAKDVYEDFTLLTQTTATHFPQYATARAIPIGSSPISHSPRSPKQRFSEMTSMINNERKLYVTDGDDEEDDHGYDYDLLLSDADEVLSVHEQPLLQESAESSSRKCKKIDFLYGCCRLFYLLAAAVIVLTAAGFIAFYPQYPEYNVCSDEMDWKSIVDGMTSIKMEASFQVLISVENRNKLDAVIDQGSGSFKHDGVHVGTFEMPAGVTLQRMAITDYLVNINITPDKWQALELTSEYYKGTLKFLVEAEIDITIPALGGYTFQSNISNYMIHVGDAMSDRHLCACQSWKQTDE